MQKKTLEDGEAMLDQMNFSMIQSQSRMAQEEKDLETLLSTFTESQENQQDQNSSQDNNVIPKKKNKQSDEGITATQKLKQETY